MSPGRVARKIAVAAAVTRASSAGRHGRGDGVLWRGMSSNFARELRSAPNLLSLSRIVLALAAVPLFVFVSPGLALVVGTVGALTDLFDGMLARATGQVTRLGEILDQFGDLVFESSMLLLAVARGFFPAALLGMYLLREFWVSGIRRFMAGEGINIPRSLSGKLKTHPLLLGLPPTSL